MKIVVGLGNPGKQYEGTPHNAGFEVVNELAARGRGSWKISARDKAELAEIQLGAERVLLVKPTTYMNLSGQAVREAMRNRPVELDDLLIVSDDINLDIGRLRIRADGSHGGQNGLRSIVESLGSEGFARLRVGIRPAKGEIESLTKYVLGRPRPEDRKRLAETFPVAADAAERWIAEGVEATANRYNGTGV